MAREAIGPRSRWIALLLAIPLVLAPASGGQAMAESSDGVDEAASARFVEEALWPDRGTAVDFPDHVVFPADTMRTLRALEAAGEEQRVDPALAAAAAARAQTESGGFLSFHGDFLGPQTSATGAGIVLANEHGAAIDEQAAEAFLFSMQNSDGGFAPRKSISGGNLGSQVSSTFYAALGLQTLDALDGETRDEILAYLQEARNADGGWGPTTGSDTSLTSSTYVAVRALDLLDALDPATKLGVVGYLSIVEDPLDGGFEEHYQPPTCYRCEVPPPSVPSTGMALLVLDRLGPASLAFDVGLHADWLAERQLEEGLMAGSFPLYGPAPPTLANEAGSLLAEAPVVEELGPPFPRPDPPVTDNARNTALVLAGLLAHDEVDAIDAEAATTFLVETQHEGTGGFGWWPGYLEEQDATAAAYRSLDVLDEADANLADALATTIGDWQTDEGAIVRSTWSLGPRVDHTARGVSALAHADRLGAIDAQAVVDYIASTQTDEGTFQTPVATTAPHTTLLALTALDHLSALDAVDTDAASEDLADLQEPDGRITTVRPGDRVAIWDTAKALRALAVADRLDAVDVDAAIGFLADRQTDEGSFRDLPAAAHTVLALASIDRLDAIDTDGARAFLEDQQRDHGGFATKGFPLGPNPMVRHALALEAIEVLGSP